MFFWLLNQKCIIIKFCSRFLGQPRLQGSIIAQLVNWVLFVYGLRPHQTFISKSFFTCLSTPYKTDAYSAVVIPPSYWINKKLNTLKKFKIKDLNALSSEHPSINDNKYGDKICMKINVHLLSHNVRSLEININLDVVASL